MGAFHPAMTPVAAGGGGVDDPLDIYGTDLVLWLRADAATASQWTDASTHGNDVTQGTGANQPVVNSGGQNGRAYVTFDGSNDYYALATGFAGYPAGSGATVFIVARRGGTSDTLLNLENSSNANAIQVRVDSSGFHGFTVVVNNGGAAQSRGALGTVAPSTGSVVLFQGWITSSPVVRQNVSGSDETSSSAAASDDTHADVDGAIIGQNIALNQAFAGDMYEVIVAKVNDDTKRASVLTYVEDYYAIDVTP